MITTILSPIFLKCKEAEGLGQEAVQDVLLYPDLNIIVVSAYDAEDRYPYVYTYSITPDDIPKLLTHRLTKEDGTHMHWPESKEVPELEVRYMAELPDGRWLNEDEAYDELGEDEADELEFMPIVFP